MNDLEWLFHVKLGFSTSFIDSEGSSFKDNYVKTEK